MIFLSYFLISFWAIGLVPTFDLAISVIPLPETRPSTRQNQHNLYKTGARTTELKADEFIGADELGNLFYLENQVFYRKSGARIFSFSNVDLGEISQVDVSNPFKILLFYKDFNSVIILDNNLNELSQRLDFTQETLFNNVIFVSNSSANNIWLYADDNKLHLYNYKNLSEEVQTQATTFYQSDFIALDVVSSFKNVWIQSKAEALQFNEYGNYVQTYAIKDTDQIFPFKKGILILTQINFEYYFDDREQDGEASI